MAEELDGKDLNAKVVVSIAPSNQTKRRLAQLGYTKQHSFFAIERESRPFLLLPIDSPHLFMAGLRIYTPCKKKSENTEGPYIYTAVDHHCYQRAGEGAGTSCLHASMDRRDYLVTQQAADSFESRAALGSPCHRSDGGEISSLCLAYKFPSRFEQDQFTGDAARWQDFGIYQAVA